MNGGSPKISFIPKSPLGEEDIFIARPRPRSVLGFLAVLLFLASVGAYTGIYFYDDFISRNIQKKTGEIEMAQRALKGSPEIGKAKVFNARADLARALLEKHIVISPIFDFLSQNTLKSILYKDFIFKDEGGKLAVSLKGESPSYSSLAYQTDVFRASKELLGFSIDNIELTKDGGVSFSFEMSLDRALLSYEKHIKTGGGSAIMETPLSPAGAMATTTIPVNTPKKENKATSSLINFL
ncbi:MAG: hypothetical protein HY228_02520 [Candidatus Yonathbacteria bacterium]|nr:hypothetical protein [Candidatus Yonathbacteria bacterium]